MAVKNNSNCKKQRQLKLITYCSFHFYLSFYFPFLLGVVMGLILGDIGLLLGILGLLLGILGYYWGYWGCYWVVTGMTIGVIIKEFWMNIVLVLSIQYSL